MTPLGRTQTTAGYAVVTGETVTYFMPPSDDPGDDDTARAATDHQLDQGGTLYRVTVKSEVIEAQKLDDNQAWVAAGMEGLCPLCGEPSGCHTDEGDCDGPATDGGL